MYKNEFLEGWLKCTSDIVIIVDSNFKIINHSTTFKKYFREPDVKKNNFDFFNWSTEWKADFSCLKSVHQKQIDWKNHLIDPNTQYIYFFEWTIMSYTQNSTNTVYILIGKKNRRSKFSSNENSYYLENYFNNFPCSFFIKNKEGIYLSCNQFTAYLAGVNNPNEVIGKTDHDFSWAEPDEVIKIRENDNKVIQTGKICTFEEKVKLPNGNIAFFLSHKSPLVDANNTTVGIMGLSLDITDHKQRELELDQAREVVEMTLKNVIEQIPGSIYWKNTEGVYLGSNTRVAKMAGLNSVDDIIGKSDENMPWINDLENIVLHDKIVIETGQNLEVEEKGELADGSEINLLTNKSPFFNKEGKIIGVIGVSLDITNQKELEKKLKKAKEEAETANLVKSAFIANMSHDIRTPLAGIHGIAEYLSSHVTSPQNKHFVEMLIHATDDLIDLFNSIIELTKTEFQEEPENNKFNLIQTIQKVVNVMAPTCVTGGIGFNVSISPDFPVFVIGSHLFIHRILLNLIGNAIKFTKKGEISIFAKFQMREGKEGTVILEVQDTGIGIPADKQASIFERFTRLTASHEGKYKGMGLGLYIVKQYLEKMHGEIYVESEVDKGSKFTCIIPIKIPQLSEEENQQLENESARRVTVPTLMPIQEEPLPKISLNDVPGIGKSKKEQEREFIVLLVEDNPMVQAVTRLRLQDENCQVDVAGDGKTAIEFFAKNSYDVIFMDVGLPDMDGLDVTREIRKQEKERNTGHVPIVAITAHVDGEVKDRCLEAGFDEAHTKPLTDVIIKSVIKNYFGSVDDDKIVFERPQENKALHKQDIIDLKQASTILGSEEKALDYLHQIVESFPGDRKKLEDAYQAENWKNLRFTAHYLYGALCFTGLPRLKAILKEMELAVDDKQFELLDAIVDDFMHEYDLFFDEYQRLISKAN